MGGYIPNRPILIVQNSQTDPSALHSLWIEGLTMAEYTPTEAAAVPATVSTPRAKAFAILAQDMYAMAS